MADINLKPNINRLNRQRKEEHLFISLNSDVASKTVTTGLEDYYFVHEALPEIDLADVELKTTLFGKMLMAPLVISPMVGGIDSAININHNLAQAAQSLGLAMGVGSQRCMIEEQDFTSTYKVRDIAPDILLFANLGAVQLNNGYTVDDCRWAVESIEADALILHLNPLQEALQREGNTNFVGLLPKIEAVCRVIGVPVIAKEVGWGISEQTARRLAAAGVAGIDVSGAGGTSWSRIESHRTGNSAVGIASAMASWGIPTAASVKMVQKGAPGMTVIASGGIRTGLDTAKVLALGADAAGIATPLLAPASISAEGVMLTLSDIISTLKTVMFCIGAVNIKELRNTTALVSKNER